MTCLTTGMIALFCSVLFQKTSISLMTTYVIIILLFCAPLAVTVFMKSFQASAVTNAPNDIQRFAVTSPFAAAFSVPLKVDEFTDLDQQPAAVRYFPPSWSMWASYMGSAALLNACLLSGMIWLFRTRWRVAQS